MCGRINLRTPSAAWCQMFLPDMTPGEVAEVAGKLDTGPRYNIAPTQMIPCVARHQTGDPRCAFLARWGLLPPWATDLAIGSRMINARGETIDEKRSFKKPFASQRCLIPADGYYEWMKTADGKQPYLIERRDHGLLAMAGLWEQNKKLGSDDEPLITCTVITTGANAATETIHHRMPVILDVKDHDRWLDPGFRDLDQLKSLLVPASDDLLTTVAVSRRVNSVKYDDESCMKAVEPPARPGSLFD